MALSFLNLAFIRILQWHRQRRQGGDDLAIEVVMLRCEVAVSVARWSGRPWSLRIEPCSPG